MTQIDIGAAEVVKIEIEKEKSVEDSCWRRIWLFHKNGNRTKIACFGKDIP